MQNPLTQAEKNAEVYGVDLNLLEYNLSLTYEQRLEQHQAALALANEIRKNSGIIHGESEPAA